jgi:hypothetical protein
MPHHRHSRTNSVKPTELIAANVDEPAARLIDYDAGDVSLTTFAGR